MRGVRSGGTSHDGWTRVADVSGGRLDLGATSFPSEGNEVKNWRTVALALCITMVMVLGAFAGLATVIAPSGASVGVSPNIGTRGEDRRLMSAFDESHTAMSTGDAETFAANPHAYAGPAAAVAADPGAQATTLGPALKPVSQEELKRALVQGGRVTYNGEGGKIEMQMNHGEGTRNHLVGTGAISAGGPYGGPTSCEGSTTVTFRVVGTDPSLIFFRWDFNNDGIYDEPNQAGGGNMGKWTTDKSVSRSFDDDYFGKVVVQGWDGVSTNVVINSGDNGVSAYAIQYLIGYGTYTLANRFQAKASVKMTEIGHYHYAYNLFETAIYSA